MKIIENFRLRTRNEETYYSKSSGVSFLMYFMILNQMAPTAIRYGHLLQSYGWFYEYNVENYSLVEMKYIL